MSQCRRCDNVDKFFQEHPRCKNINLAKQMNLDNKRALQGITMEDRVMLGRALVNQEMVIMKFLENSSYWWNEIRTILFEEPSFVDK